MGLHDLATFHTHAARVLRDDRLGSDARLGVSLEIASPRAREEFSGLMCLFSQNPLSIGLESAHGLFLPVIARNWMIPTRRIVHLRWEAGAFFPTTVAAQKWEKGTVVDVEVRATQLL